MNKKQRINPFQTPELSIIIPVYNGEDDILKLYKRLLDELENKYKISL